MKGKKFKQYLVVWKACPSNEWMRRANSKEELLSLLTRIKSKYACWGNYKIYTFKGYVPKEFNNVHLLETISKI